MFWVRRAMNPKKWIVAIYGITVTASIVYFSFELLKYIDAITRILH